jgi:hypothetical protein
MYPDWVIKYHTKGTTIKKIKDNYYLYKATSKYSKEKGYPVSIQKYIGKITENGVVEPDRVSFTPGYDKIVLASSLIENIKEKDLDIINQIALIEIEGIYYIGKLTTGELKVLNKYLKVENNMIRK